MKTLKIAAAAMVACLLASAVSAFAPVGNVSVPYATPKVDGIINVDEYSAEGKVIIDQKNATAGGWLGEVPAANSIELYCAWDDTNFYVAANVTDPEFNYTTNAEGYNGDAFQVSLNVDNVFKTEDSSSRAIFYSWGLQENGTIDVMRQESANNGLITGAGKGQKTDKGWCFEVALNLEMLAEDVSAKANIDAIVEHGMPIGGLLCYLDRDATGGLANAYATAATDTVGWDPAAHGLTFVFAEQVVETEPETEAEVVEEVADAAAAPATFDAGVIAAVAAIVSAAGYAISKKR